jgi:hypothetical protein
MSAAHGTSEGSAPTILGYEILRLLGTGGMGKVYLARQEALNRLVCVKVLSIPDGEDADLCRTRFGREAVLLANLTHPHILSLFDFGMTDDMDMPFLVTEYIEGGDLRRRMTAGKPMPTPRVHAILCQVGGALEYLHGKGIIHRDLKPENILLPTDSQCKVCDFGLAVMRDNAGAITNSGHGLGTLGYVSPEQHYGLKMDERTDQYALAALGYELVTGRRPLGSFLPPSRLNPRLPRELDSIVLRGLAEERRDRYPSVRDFLTALEPHLGASPRNRRVRLAVAGLLLVLVIAAAVVLIAGIGVGSGPLGDLRAVQEPLAPANQPVPVPAEKTPGGAPAENTAGAAAPVPTPRSAEFKRLTELRAYRLWIGEGRPLGEAGEAVKDKNWSEAEKQIEAEVKARAYKIWEQQGRPTGPDGAAVSVTNHRAAELELLNATEEELHKNPIH